MSFLDQWTALATNMQQLVRAGELHARFLAIRSSDTFARAAYLGEQLEQVLAALESFVERYRQLLPSAAATVIADFVSRVAPLVRQTNVTADMRQEGLWAALVMLGAFEPQVTFLLSDVQQAFRIRSERTFALLQRKIVVDGEFRRKWRTAFDVGEVECEKLGAIELLGQGIYAFKVNAEGARTDLVYPEAVGEQPPELGYADGLVLTEWKIAKPDTEAPRRFKEARDQARRYAQGALAGAELTAYRFAVVVTLDQVSLPPDDVDGGVTYRYINIAIEPRTPSRARRT